MQIDCNLYGMGHVKLSKVAFRGALPDTGHPEQKGWNPRQTIIQDRFAGEAISCCWARAKSHHCHKIGVRASCWRILTIERV